MAGEDEYIERLVAEIRRVTVETKQLISIQNHRIRCLERQAQAIKKEKQTRKFEGVRKGCPL